MQSSHIFVLLIIFICAGYGLAARVLKERARAPRKAEVEESENMLARINELEERVRILEQIITDPKESLSRKISNL